MGDSQSAIEMDRTFYPRSIRYGYNDVRVAVKRADRKEIKRFIHWESPNTTICMSPYNFRHVHSLHQWMWYFI